MAGTYQRKDGDIVMFKQVNRTNPKAPEFKGTILWNGVEYDVACWEKREGMMLTGNMQAKRAKGENQPYVPQSQPAPKEYKIIEDSDPFGFESEIPF